MKLFVPILILLLFTSCEYEKSGPENFASYGYHDGVTSFTVPGWAIHLTAQWGDLEKEERELLKNIDKVRVHILEGNNLPNRKIMQKEFNRTIRENGKMEELLVVQNDNEKILVFGKTDDDSIEEMVVLVSGDDNVLIHLKCKLEMEQISDFVNHNSQKEFFGFKN